MSTQARPVCLRGPGSGVEASPRDLHQRDTSCFRPARGWGTRAPAKGGRESPKGRRDEDLAARSLGADDIGCWHAQCPPPPPLLALPSPARERLGVPSPPECIVDVEMWSRRSRGRCGGAIGWFYGRTRRPVATTSSPEVAARALPCCGPNGGADARRKRGFSCQFPKRWLVPRREGVYGSRIWSNDDGEDGCCTFPSLQVKVHDGASWRC